MCPIFSKNLSLSITRRSDIVHPDADSRKRSSYPTVCAGNRQCTPAYATDVFHAVKHAFADNRLGRRFKEALAFAVSLTTRSPFGTAFHLGEMKRLGVRPRGVMEILGVAQMFSSYTKIADTLQLEPDMGHIAPADPSPAPGGCPSSG